nr:hypothetical protein [uncultured Acetatifactor sp.]
MLNNKYGDFLPDGRQFRITTPDIPRNWYNYLWNDNYITFVSQTGAGDGFLQDGMGNRIGLVAERGLYLLRGRKEGDSTESWGICGLPVEQVNESYECIHSPGATSIHTKKNGIYAAVTFFVPVRDACEIWNVNLRNDSGERQELKLIGACGTVVDDRYARQGYNVSAAAFDRELNGIKCRRHCDFAGVKNRQFLGFMALSETADSYECTMNRITGPYGSFAYPICQKRGGLTGTEGNSEKLGFALQKNLVLEAGESMDITFVCGVAFSDEEAVKLRQRYRKQEDVLAAKEEAQRLFSSQVEQVEIDTPDRELNKLFFWLKHQANMGSRWARVRHNGYRDMTSDTECLAAVNPELALTRFKRVLSYQYSNGYAPRTISGGRICDNNFSDNAVWISFTANTILKELGDRAVMDETVPFNDGSESSVYEHVRRSVDFLYHFRGRNGLIRIWGGDWNDCMNEAGMKGEGVSVWLSIAWYRANEMFREIAQICGRQEDAALCVERGREIRELVETYGWDGEYYLTAIADDGTPIGSRTNEEGQMFLPPQLWAVLSGVSKDGRHIQAMDAVEKYLSTPLGTVISVPAYTKYDSRIGSVTLKPAGVHENGGVYLHTIAWKIAADAMLKRRESVEQDLECILPFRNKVVAGRAEPYILCNSYFGEQTGYRYGTPGQSWRTAAGPWLEKALLGYVFGLMPQMEGLKIDPCLPKSWKNCSVKKRFRGATYQIHYENGGPDVIEIMVDGKAVPGNVLPWEEGKTYQVYVTTGVRKGE